MKPQHIPSRTHQLYIEVVVKVLDFITTAFQLVKIRREGEIATDQIRTVDKSRLKRKIGDLNFSEIKRLREVFQQMFCE